MVWALANGAPPYPRASREEEVEEDDEGYDVDDMGPWDEDEDEEGYGSGGSGWSEEFEDEVEEYDEDDMYEDDFADDDDFGVATYI